MCKVVALDGVRKENVRLIRFEPKRGCHLNQWGDSLFEAQPRPLTVSKGENMTKLHLKGNWNIPKGKLKQKWAQLTDSDLQYVEGKEDELIGRIQKRTGQNREAVERALEECGC